MSTPFAIIPKFLWTEIIRYLPYKSTIIMAHVHPQFDAIVDWKYCFDNRPDDIAIVFSNTNKLDWRHACITYIGCNNINNLLTNLQAMLKNRKSRKYYYFCKVIIKSGRYEYKNYIGIHNLSYINCSIELIGSDDKSNRTSIYCDNSTVSFRIEISASFIVKQIDIVNLHFTLMNSNDIDTMALFDDCAITYTLKSSIPFNRGLQITSIRHIIIKNCIFQLFATNNSICICVENIYPRYIPTISIDHCQFTCKSTCMGINHKKNTFIDISFSNNIVNSAEYVFVSKYSIEHQVRSHNNIYNTNVELYRIY